MPSYKITPQAECDLEEIWIHTYKKWGKNQADKYIREMNASFSKADEIGKSCNEIRHGYYRYIINRHIVYYKIISSQIKIIRILHQRMHVPKHL